MVFYNFIVNLDWSGCLYNINLTKSKLKKGDKNKKKSKFVVFINFNLKFISETPKSGDNNTNVIVLGFMMIASAITMLLSKLIMNKSKRH